MSRGILKALFNFSLRRRVCNNPIVTCHRKEAKKACASIQETRSQDRSVRVCSCQEMYDFLEKPAWCRQILVRVSLVNPYVWLEGCDGYKKDLGGKHLFE